MILAIIPTTAVTMMMKFTKKKFLKCLWVMKDVDIVLLVTANLPQLIMEVADIGLLIPSTLPLSIVEDIILLMLLEVDLGHNRPATITIAIR